MNRVHLRRVYSLLIVLLACDVGLRESVAKASSPGSIGKTLQRYINWVPGRMIFHTGRNPELNGIRTAVPDDVKAFLKENDLVMDFHQTGLSDNPANAMALRHVEHSEKSVNDVGASTSKTDRPVLLIYQGLFLDFQGDNLGGGEHGKNYHSFAKLAKALDADVVVFNYPKNTVPEAGMDGMLTAMFTATARLLLHLKLDKRHITTYGECAGGGVAVAMTSMLGKEFLVNEQGRFSAKVIADRSFYTAADTAQHIIQYYTSLPIPLTRYHVSLRFPQWFINGAFSLTKWNFQPGPTYWDEIPGDRKISFYFAGDDTVSPTGYLGRPPDNGGATYSLSLKEGETGPMTHNTGIRHLNAGYQPAVQVMKDFMWRDVMPAPSEAALAVAE